MMKYADALKKRIETWTKANRAAIERLYLDRASTVSYLQEYSDRTQDISESLAAILDTIAPNDMTLRNEFVEVLNLTRKESVTLSFDLELYKSLAELADKEPDNVGARQE